MAQIAKSGQTIPHRLQPVQRSASTKAGGWYPLALSLPSATRTWTGQNSIQKPQPLHHSSLTYTRPWGLRAKVVFEALFSSIYRTRRTVCSLMMCLSRASTCRCPVHRLATVCYIPRVRALSHPNTTILLGSPTECNSTRRPKAFSGFSEARRDAGLFTVHGGRVNYLDTTTEGLYHETAGAPRPPVKGKTE